MHADSLSHCHGLLGLVLILVHDGMYLCVYVRYNDTHHADELRQRHLNRDGDLLALIDSWSDQFVVAFWTQKIVHQSLLCILCTDAFKNIWITTL